MSTRPTSTSIERARAEDVGDVCVALVEAFRDNPVAAWVIADADQRATVLRGRFELLVETFLRKKRATAARDEVRAHPSQTPRFRIGGNSAATVRLLLPADLGSVAVL